MNSKTDEFIYRGEDLEAMVGAKNYYQWLLSSIKPYLGKSVVEVGAGVGSFSKFLLQQKPKHLTLIEPSKQMYKLLSKNINDLQPTDTELTILNGYLPDFKTELKKLKPDTFVYINVFEHIKDDQNQINEVSKLIEKNGQVIIFVPALQKLYSEFDKSIDHYRRYSKKSLRTLCESAGFEVVKLRYMDMVGVVPWYFSFVLMKRTKLVPALVKTYDTIFVPVIRLFETFLPVPLGKNVLIVARKK